MKTQLIGSYSRHRCTKNHRTGVAMARCLWTEHVSGSGEYAVLVICARTEVALYATPSAALAVKEELDRTSCGDYCRMNHSVVHLVLPERYRSFSWDDSDYGHR